MINFEKYKNKIINAINNGKGMTISEDNKFITSDFFSGIHNESRFIMWGLEEYVEVPTLTKNDSLLLQLLDDDKWIARDEDGAIHIYETEPYKDVDHWDVDVDSDFNRLSCVNIDLDFIKWEDSAPWKVANLRKLKVEENT